MKHKHIKARDIVENNYGTVVVQNLINDESWKQFSVVKITVKGKPKLGANTLSDTAYYVLEGHGKFHFEEEVIDVRKGDLVLIPKNVKYKDSGQLTLLAIAVPPFDRNKQVYFETE